MMKRNWLAVSKLTRRFWRILPRALESLKNLHFNCLLLTRVYNVWAKKVRRSCVITLKNDEKFVEELACHFKIDIRNFCKFWLEHSKVWKICTLIGCFWPKCLSKKSTEELCLMALNIDTKFEEKLTLAFKNDMKNLTNFPRWKKNISF